MFTLRSEIIYVCAVAHLLLERFKNVEQDECSNLGLFIFDFKFETRRNHFNYYNFGCQLYQLF